MTQTAQLDSYFALVSTFLDFQCTDLTAYSVVCLPSRPLYNCLLILNIAILLNKALCPCFRNTLLIFFWNATPYPTLSPVELQTASDPEAHSADLFVSETNPK